MLSFRRTSSLIPLKRRLPASARAGSPPWAWEGWGWEVGGERGEGGRVWHIPLRLNSLKSSATGKQSQRVFLGWWERRGRALPNVQVRAFFLQYRYPGVFEDGNLLLSIPPPQLLRTTLLSPSTPDGLWNYWMVLIGVITEPLCDRCLVSKGSTFLPLKMEKVTLQKTRSSEGDCRPRGAGPPLQESPPVDPGLAPRSFLGGRRGREGKSGAEGETRASGQVASGQLFVLNIWASKEGQMWYLFWSLVSQKQCTEISCGNGKGRRSEACFRPVSNRGPFAC